MLSSIKDNLRQLRKGPLRGMETGTGVIIERPHRISAPKYIRVGDRTFIHRNAMITPILEYEGMRYTPTVSIGSDVYIGPNLYLACLGRVVIGDGSVLSEYVYINDSSHGIDPDGGPIMKQPLVHGGDVVIGKSCFLGLRVAIMPGVTLGDHCVVGTNSVVMKSFPPYSMLSGSPARLLGQYDRATKTWVRVE